MSDSDDSSDSSSCSDSTFENPTYSTAPKGSAKTAETYDDDSSSGGSFASNSDSDSDSDSNNEKPVKPKKKPPAKVDTSAMPEGISEEAMKAFFSTPLEDEVEKEAPRRKAPTRTPSIGLDASEHLARQTEKEMEKRRNELSQSMHSLDSAEELLHSFEDFELDEPETVEDIDIASMAEAYKKEPKEKKAPTVSQTTLLKNKREMRLAKVRERLRKKEEEKELEEDQKMEQKMKDAMCPTGSLDMSEAARRDRAYSWYTRMAMPNKKAMKEKVDMMPSSSGLSVDDVDLLPWNASGRVVNVAKMQKFINAGFKKKFTSRRKKAVVDSDSDSD